MVYAGPDRVGFEQLRPALDRPDRVRSRPWAEDRAIFIEKAASCPWSTCPARIAWEREFSWPKASKAAGRGTASHLAGGRDSRGRSGHSAVSPPPSASCPPPQRGRKWLEKAIAQRTTRKRNAVRSGESVRDVAKQFTDDLNAARDAIGQRRGRVAALSPTASPKLFVAPPAHEQELLQRTLDFFGKGLDDCAAWHGRRYAPPTEDFAGAARSAGWQLSSSELAQADSTRRSEFLLYNKSYWGEGGTETDWVCGAQGPGVLSAPAPRFYRASKRWGLRWVGGRGGKGEGSAADEADWAWKDATGRTRYISFIGIKAARGAFDRFSCRIGFRV